MSISRSLLTAAAAFVAASTITMAQAIPVRIFPAGYPTPPFPVGGPVIPVPPSAGSPGGASLFVWNYNPIGSPTIAQRYFDNAASILSGTSWGISTGPANLSLFATPKDAVLNSDVHGEDLIITNLNPSGGTANGAIRFGTTPDGSPAGAASDQERMTILNNGNIGIGNTAPVTKVWIEGDPWPSQLNASMGAILEVFDKKAATVLPSYGGVGLGSFPGIDYSIGKKTVSASETYFQIRNQQGAELVTVSATGNTGIGSSVPLAKLQVKDGSVLFNGTTGGTPISGSGTRFMWIPAKDAIRAGEVQNTEWDDALIGDYSVGMGRNTTASGRASVALGENTTVGGWNAVALNYETQAPAYAQTVVGRYNVVKGTEDADTWVDGDPLFVVGNGDVSIPTNAVTVMKDGRVGLGKSTAYPLNTLDVKGAAVIGRLYSGATTAPADGLLVQGNVGIGTDDPQNELDVYGGMVVGSQYAGVVSVPNGTILADESIGINTTTTNNRLDVGGAATVGVGYAGSATAPSNGLLVEGKLGVGTSSPQSKLDVEGGASIGAGYSGTSAAPTNGLLVEGTVGIGTAAPVSKLDVGGGVSIGAGYAGTSAAPASGLVVEGRVGIGTATPGLFELYVNGDAYATTGWFSSDARLKRDVTPIGGALEKVMKLQGVRYHWNSEAFPERKLRSEMEIGFIAQDLEKTVPEVVRTNDDGFKAVAYQNLTALLAEGIKEQQGTIATLAADNRKLQQRLDEQLVRIARLEQALERFESGANGGATSGMEGSQARGTSQARVFQNDPNPFSESTRIGYSIPSGSTHASLFIYQAATGRQMMEIALDGRTEGEVIVNGKDLGSGSFYYNLVVDGAVVPGKSMIVVR